jgi:hypothetical protein
VPTTDAAELTARSIIDANLYLVLATIGTGQGVYMSAVAEQVDSDDLTRGMATFSRRSLAHGGAEWTVKDVQAESGLRLHRAVADSYSILAKDGRPDHRIPTYPA